MGKIRIEGGRQLEATYLSVAKNAVLKLMAAALMAPASR